MLSGVAFPWVLERERKKVRERERKKVREREKKKKFVCRTIGSRYNESKFCVKY